MIKTVQQNKWLQFAILLVVFAILCIIIAPSDSNYLWRLPPLIKEFPIMINDSVK